MYDVPLYLALASPVSDKCLCLSYSKLLFSVVCLRGKYLLLYTGVAEKYGEQQ